MTGHFVTVAGAPLCAKVGRRIKRTGSEEQSSTRSEFVSYLARDKGTAAYIGRLLWDFDGLFSRLRRQRCKNRYLG